MALARHNRLGPVEIASLKIEDSKGGLNVATIVAALSPLPPPDAVDG